MSELKIGDWVTQYAAGYWQIVDIKPKYADEDYEGEKISWKKGDRIGEWCIMKKVFTPKMKFRLEMGCSDSTWCKKITENTRTEIQSYFEKNPSDWERFLHTPIKMRPAVSNLWLNMDEENAEKVENILKSLPVSFTREDLFTIFDQENVSFGMGRPPAAYLLNLFFYLYEIDDKGEMHFRKAELIAPTEKTQSRRNR